MDDRTEIGNVVHLFCAGRFALGGGGMGISSTIIHPDASGAVPCIATPYGTRGDGVSNVSPAVRPTTSLATLVTAESATAC